MVKQPRPAVLHRAYRLMRQRHGHQLWWPGETPFEICVGAILTQNTNWANVERAIQNLRDAALLEPARLYALPEAALAQLIQPAGYFNVKARRVRSFLKVLVEEFHGDLKLMFAGATADVRERLLGIPGIGAETADSMLLYAGGHSSFVIDAYTKRIFERHRWCGEEATYEDLQTLCARSLGRLSDLIMLDYWQDYHAQLVAVGKRYCRKTKPQCDQCPLKPLLPGPPARG